MTEEIYNDVVQKILNYSGLKADDIQKNKLSVYLAKSASKLGTTLERYCESLVPGTREFNALISQITINETYFFREEKQFDVLREDIFPRFVGKKLTVWSAACSTGEEAVSLLALALSMNIDAEVYASDIDEEALSVLKTGVYSWFSFRADGKKYHDILNNFVERSATGIKLGESITDRISAFKYNLIAENEIPFAGLADLVFLRNVFIYFDKETRQKIAFKIADKIKDGGYLFYSMNEIGSIGDSLTPKALRKINRGSVYYFEKRVFADKTPPLASGLFLNSEKTIANSDDCAAVFANSSELERQKKLKNEVEKARALVSLANRGVKKSADADSARVKTEAREQIIDDNERAPLADVRKCYDDVCREISSGDFESARKIAENLSDKNHLHYSYFLQGYAEYFADNKARAEELFYSAERARSDFWPAYFFHGLLSRDVGKTKNAEDCFRRCRELLDEFEKRNPYEFILDSFSPAYINSLCDSFANNRGSVE